MGTTSTKFFYSPGELAIVNGLWVCTTAEDDEAVVNINGTSNPLLPDITLNGAGGYIEFPQNGTAHPIFNGDTVSVDSEFRATSAYIIANILAAPITLDFSIKILLSTDNVPDAQDVVVVDLPQNFSFDHPGDYLLSKGGFPQTFSLPPNTTPGTYFFIIKIDTDNEIEESDETNNIFALPIKGSDNFIFQCGFSPLY